MRSDFSVLHKQQKLHCNNNIVLYKFGIINSVTGQGLKEVKWYGNSTLLTLQVSILARIMTGD